MKTKEISVNVSKKIGQPEFSSTMLSASIVIEVDESEVEEAYKIAWRKAWAEIELQEATLKSKLEIKETVEKEPEWMQGPPPTTPAYTVPPATQSTNVCGVHGTQMTFRPAGVSKTTGKPYPGFWACSSKNADGSFCKYKP